MKKLILQYLFALLAIAAQLSAFAANEKISSPIWRTADLTVSNSMTIADGQYTNMGAEIASNPTHHARQFANFYNKKVTNRLIFKVDQQNRTFQPNAYLCNVLLRITTKTYSGNSTIFTTETHDKNITVNYNPLNTYNDQNVYEFTDQVGSLAGAGYELTVEILAVTSLMNTANLLFYTEIETERYYTFNFATTYSSLNQIPASNINAVFTTNNLRISWTPAAWAEQYDLEWFHVSNLGQTLVPATAITYHGSSFRWNSTRVTVTNSSFEIPLIYGQGYIVFRVRGYGKIQNDNFTELVPGYWSTDNQCTGTCLKLSDLNSACYALITSTNAHEERLNWSYDFSFAEEGKHKVGVSYFDGTLRSRQTLVKSNIFDRVLVSEKIYDFEGRPAIEVLPAPHQESKISYKKGFSTNSANKVYSRLDFDVDAATCSTATPAMNTATGSANYYSPSSNVATGLSLNNAYLKQFEKYIPNAEGYPFSQTIYTPDNTGDVKIKTGVGADFKLGSQKVSRHFYGKPFQEELDRLFGYEVGNAIGYNKNMVIDPNGQVSISYLNPAGKVIASNLSGNDPSSLTSIRTVNVATTPDFKVDLLNKPAFSSAERGSENIFDLSTRSLKMNRTLLVDKEQDYFFGYENRGKRVTYTCNTPTVKEFCFDCVFDLKISLTDECGVEYLAGINASTPSSTTTLIGQSIFTDITSSSPTYNSLTRCSTNLSNVPSINNNIPSGVLGDTWRTRIAGTNQKLKEGAYQLKKELVLNEKVLNYYVNDYITRNTGCFKSIDYFRDQFAFINDVYDCNMNCAECLDRLGPYTNYSGTTRLANYPELTQQAYDELVAKCNARCEITSKKCEAGYETMLLDMSPNGQYGEIFEKKLMDGGVIQEYEGSNAIKPYLHPLSVFNHSNFLPLKASFNGRLASWKYPYTESNQPHYFNEKGEIDYIALAEVEIDGKNVLRPEVSDYVTIDGAYFAEPQYLLKVEDFISYFKPSWARSLVMYHPEYPLYILCGSNEFKASHNFDEKWNYTERYDDARQLFGNNIFAGELNPIGTGWNGNNPAQGVVDPYFDVSVNTYVTRQEYESMANMMQEFASDGKTKYSIWQIAYHLANHPNENLGNCNITNTFNFDINNPTILNAGDVDRFWKIFRGLYQSLKQRIQQKSFAKLSIKDPQFAGYNGCIGNGNFNPTKYGFLKFPLCSVQANLWAASSPWFFGFWWSQYFNFEQPCNWSRAYLYQDKTSRFPISTDALKINSFGDVLAYNPNGEETYVLSQTNQSAILNETNKGANLAVYNQCDKCPVASQLESILNRLASFEIVSNRRIWSCSNTADDNFNMIDQELKTKLGVSGQDIDWIVTSNKDDELIGSIGNCDVQLVVPAAFRKPLPMFNQLIGLYNLKYKHNPTLVTGVNNTFEVLAYFNPRKPNDPAFDIAESYQVMLEGKISCLDIANCTLAPICEPTKLAMELVNVFNILASEPDATQNDCNGTIPTVTPEFTSTVKVELTSGRFLSSLTSNLKFELDQAISPSLVNLNEAWSWQTNYTASNPKFMVATIKGATGSSNLGQCNIAFNITSTTSLTLAHIKRFVHIAPDPSSRTHGFIAKAFASDGSNHEYIEVRGSSNCFVFGTCKNDIQNNYNINSYLTKATYCNDFAEEAELLARLNCGDFSRFAGGGGGGGGGLITILPGGGANPSCSCYKASDNSRMDLELLKNSLNQEITAFTALNLCNASNYKEDCKIDSFLITLYDKDWKNAYVLANNANPQSTSTHLFFEMDWDCFDDDTTYIDKDGNRKMIYHYPDFKDLYIYRMCKRNQDGTFSDKCSNSFETFTDVTKGICGLKLTTVCQCNVGENQVVFGKDTVICTCGYFEGGWQGGWNPGGGGSGGGGAGYMSDNCPPIPCAIQIELPPVPGMEVQDILAFKSIKPDLDRPSPKGYFVAVVQTKGGNLITIKGYMPCLSRPVCGDCDASDLTPQNYGTFPDPTTASLPAIESDFEEVATIDFINDNIEQGYCLVDAIPSTSHLNELSNNTDDAGSKFLLAKSDNDGGVLSRLWEHSYPVQKNTLYEVSFYYANPSNAAPSNKNNQLLLSVDDQDAIGREILFDATSGWNKVTYTFNTGNRTSIKLTLNWIQWEAQTFVAIDDITFRKVCGCKDLNLLTNGNLNFVSPNQFVSDLSYKPGNTIGNGEYHYVSNVTLLNGAVVNDQLSPGVGSFVHFKVANNPGVLVKVWEKTVSLVHTGKEYVFSARWIASASANMSIYLRINNVIVQKVGSTSTVNNWLAIQARWFNHKALKVKVEILVENFDGTDHDGVLDEISFTELCNPGICPTPIFFKPQIPDCQTIITNIIELNAQSAYKQYIEEEKIKFRDDLITKCLNVYESFEMKFIQSEQHYTLYYYDQANNLVRTVPPLGVNVVNNGLGDLDAVKTDRIAKQRSFFTDHSYASTYKYNSLGGILEQSSPDQDNFNINEFYYAYDYSFNASSPTREIKASAFFKPEDGIAVGSATTTNAIGAVHRGMNLSPIQSPINWGDISSLVTVGTTANLTTVYAVSKQGQLLYSNNEGTDWFTKNTPTTEPLVEVLYLANKVFIVSANGQVWSTTNKGDTWAVEARICTDCQVKEVGAATGANVATDYLAIALSTDNRKYYKTNAQTAWTLSTLTTAVTLNALAVLPTAGTSTLIAAGENGNLYKSIDKGNNWSKVTASGTNILHFSKIAFSSATKGVAIAANTLYVTTNAGESWTAVTPTIANPVGFDKFNGVVYIVTSVGSIYKYDATGTVSAIQTNTFSGINCISVSSASTFAIGGNAGFIRVIDLVTTTNSNTLSGLGISNTITAIQFASLATGAVVTSTGQLFKIEFNATTTSYAATQKSGSNNYKGLFFNSLNTGYAYTAEGIIEQIHLLLPVSSWVTLTKGGITGSFINAFWAETDLPNSPLLAVGQVGSIFSSPSTAATWVDKSSRVTLPDLKAVKVSYNSSGYMALAVGKNGTIIRSTDNGLNWQQQHTNKKADIDEVAVGSVGGTHNAYVFTNDGVRSTVLLGTSATNFTETTTNPVPANFVVSNAVMKEFSSTVKKAVVAGVNPTNNRKEVYEIDLHTLTTSPAKLIASGVLDVTGTYAALAVHKLSATADFWVFAGGNKTASPQNDLSGVPNTNLSLYAYKNISATASAKFASTSIFNILNDVTIPAKTNTAFAVGNGGLILKSIDKGVTWQVKDSKTPADLKAVSFYDATNGVAVGNNVIAVTKDGGEVWTAYTVTGSLNDVTILDSKFAVAVGNGMKVFMVNGNDFGTASSWVENTALATAGSGFSSSINLLSVGFAGKRNGVIATNGTQCLVYKVVSTTTSPLPNPWLATAAISGLASGTQGHVTMSDLKRALLTTSDGKLFKSTEGGLTWNLVSNVPVGCSFSHIGSPDGETFYLINNNISTINSFFVRFRCIDHYGAKFFYDKLGRMVLSQNSKQQGKSTSGNQYYSYTFYDYKGRTVESGEVALPIIQLEDSWHTYNGFLSPIYKSGIVNYLVMESWIKSLNANKRTEVTRTFYDAKESSFNHLPAGFVMQNLRNRVAHVTYNEVNNSANNVFDFATHYTYDAHGNVNSILHENNQLPTSFNTMAYARFKRINYDYDLLSGKVNQVAYQAPLNAGDPPNADRYFHKYEYDAENKLTQVYTSHDGVIWQQDAKYLYYMHGPLARAEIGNDQVQGTDYAYTLQGWLKGVNSGSLDNARDIGKDGNQGDEGDLNRNFAYDEIGFTLGYYHGDYKANGSGNGSLTASSHFEIQNTTGALFTNVKSLNNGNISSMVTAIRRFMLAGQAPQARAFTYDQLNRLAEATTYTDVNAAQTNNWSTSASSNAYKEAFTYDANGNIKTLNRKDENGAAMDELDYKYANTTNAYLKNTNRLRAVYDRISTPSNSEDIESGQVFGTGSNPATDNYQYDASGNLTKDVAEGIANITWTLSGKIKTITFTSASGKDNMEFYYDPMGNRTMKVLKPQGVTDPSQFKYTVYTRDAQGNILSTYNINNNNYKQESAVIYGSSRLGDFIPNYYVDNDCGFTIPASMSLDDDQPLREFLANQLLAMTNVQNADMAWQLAEEFLYRFANRNNGFDFSNPSRENREQILRLWAKFYCNIRCFQLNNETISLLTEAQTQFIELMLSEIQGYNNQFQVPMSLNNGIVESYNYPESLWLQIGNQLQNGVMQNTYNQLSGMGLVNDCGTPYAKGSRRYELTNHLGNVLAVVSDRKISVQSGNTDMPISDSRFTYGNDGWNALAATNIEVNTQKLKIFTPAANNGVQKTIALSLPNNNFVFSFDLVKSNSGNVLVEARSASNALVASGTYSAGGSISLSINGSGFTGNVLTLIVKQIGSPSNSNAFITIDNAKLVQQGIAYASHYEADLLQASDYYAFGSLQPSRVWYSSGSKYRYGFNGMERDDEAKGNGNSYDFGARIYDSRLGRFLSMDPRIEDFPWQTSYCFADNIPILFEDIEGEGTGVPASLSMILVNPTSALKTLDARSLAIAVRGAMDAAANANTAGLYDLCGGNHTDEYSSIDDQIAYNIGRLAGDVASIATGSTEVEGGSTTASVGLATGPGALVISTSGAAVAVHGVTVVVTASADLAETTLALTNLYSKKPKADNNQNQPSANSNPSPSNQKLIEEAKAAKLKKQASQERTQKRKQASQNGNTGGNSNKTVRGDHNNLNNGKANKNDHQLANARRAKEQKKADEKKAAAKKKKTN